MFPAAGSEHVNEFLAGVHDLDVYLKEDSEGRIEEIALSEENQTLLKAVGSVLDMGLSGEAAYAALSLLISPEVPPTEGA